MNIHESYPQGASTEALLRVLKTILQAGTGDYASYHRPWKLQRNLKIAVRKRFWFWKASLTTNSMLNFWVFFKSSFLIIQISNWKGAQSTSWLEETSRVNDTEVPFRSPQSDSNIAPVGSRNWNTLHRVALLPIHWWHQRCPVRWHGIRILRKHPVAVVKGPKINKYFKVAQRRFLRSSRGWLYSQ